MPIFSTRSNSWRRIDRYHHSRQSSRKSRSRTTAISKNSKLLKIRPRMHSKKKKVSLIRLPPSYMKWLNKTISCSIGWQNLNNKKIKRYSLCEPSITISKRKFVHTSVFYQRTPSCSRWEPRSINYQPTNKYFWTGKTNHNATMNSIPNTKHTNKKQNRKSACRRKLRIIWRKRKTSSKNN